MAPPNTVTPRKQPRQARARATVEAILEATAQVLVDRGQVRPRDLDEAAFILVTAIEAVTRTAVIDRPEALADEGFVEEVSELVLRYIVDPVGGGADEPRGK